MPPSYWQITEGHLKDDLVIVQETTKTGDDCHFNIVNMSDKECKTSLANSCAGDRLICDEDGPRPITHDDVIKQRRNADLI